MFLTTSPPDKSNWPFGYWVKTAAGTYLFVVLRILYTTDDLNTSAEASANWTLIYLYPYGIAAEGNELDASLLNQNISFYQIASAG